MWRRSTITFALACGLAISPTSVVRADDSVVSRSTGTHPAAAALARAFDIRLTLRKDGARKRVHAEHCRQAKHGCRRRLAAFARDIVDRSNAVGVDPFLTAAMALRESGLNPLATGSVGERGILQLHPAYRGKSVRFVRDEGYRIQCADRDDVCQPEVLDAGLALLQWAIERCGSVSLGLGWYNSGSCARTPYSKRVEAERMRLLRIAKGSRAAPGTIFSDASQ